MRRTNGGVGCRVKISGAEGNTYRKTSTTGERSHHNLFSFRSSSDDDLSLYHTLVYNRYIT